MAGCPKFVCFITSAIIAWGISETWPAIFAWFDNKINGTEIPYDLVLFEKSLHMFLIFLQGVLLLGVCKENPSVIGFWLQFWGIGFLSLVPWGLIYVSIYTVILQYFKTKGRIENFEYQGFYCLSIFVVRLC